jgi:uncharacterized repeat protein (TIGR01451 family)
MSREYSIIRSFSQSIGRAAACLVALFIFTAMAGAATYTVDTSSDNGGLTACTDASNDCTLRGAISNANATPDSDVITFAGSYTIILTGSTLTINDAATAGSLTITKSTGASNFVIDADYRPNHFVRGFRILVGGDLTLNGVTVKNGGSRFFNETTKGGGGILNEGTLLLTNSTVSGNEAEDGDGSSDPSNKGGGGIFNSTNAIMTLENTTVSGNRGDNGGGGIYNEGTLTLTNSTVSGNSVPLVSLRLLDLSTCFGGGGICNMGTLNLTNSTVRDNSVAFAGGGGGITNRRGTLNLTNCAVVNNNGGIYPPNHPSGGGGGGISNLAGNLILVNVTVAGNSIQSSGGGIANSFDGFTQLHNVTVANNSAGGSGGGITNFGNSPLGLFNTIVAKNSATDAPDYEGILSFGAFNLVGDGTGMTGIVNGSLGNQVGGSGANQIDPKLNLNLALNGGSTLNFALLPGSPAIDKGDSEPFFDNGTDQRGLPRPSDNLNIANAPGGNGADIGAFEVQVPPSFDLTVTKTHTGNFPQGSTGNTYTITVNNNGPTATIGTVSVVDTLPTGLTATAITGTGWTCTIATLRCTRSDALAAGASYPSITLTVDVASNAPAFVINNVSVSGTGGDSNPANNQASDPTTIDGVFDLTVTKTHPGNFTQGGVGTYTIIAKNSGTGAYGGTIIVTDFLPDGLTVKGSIAGTGWNCATDALLKAFSCDRSGLLAAGASYPPITATVDVASNAPSSVTNTVSVAGSSESNKTNNTASDLTIINAATTFSISGAMRYGITDAGQSPATISGVNLNTTGTAVLSAISNAAGAYQLSNLSGGNYTVTPSKSGEIKGINSLDATRIQQHRVGLITLTPNQLIAADTDGSGAVNSLDATRIQQRAVGITAQNIIGQWKFVPANRQYNALGSNQSGQDYQAVLVGEVSGNWASAASFADDSETDEEILPKQDVQSDTAGKFDERLSQQTAERMKQSADSQSNESKSESAIAGGVAVNVSLPTNASVSTGSSITIPVTVGAVSAGTPIESFDFTVFYDPAVLQPASPSGSNTGTLSANCSVLANSPLSGRVVVSGACATAITTSSGGVLYNLQFNVIGSSGQRTGLLFNNPSTGAQTFQFNSGTPAANTTNGSFSVLGPTAAGVNVSGRVTNNQGRGIRNVLITMTDSTGNERAAQTTAFGYYKFESVAAGETVTVTAKARRFRFVQSSIVRTTNESVSNADFVSEQ